MVKGILVNRKTDESLKSQLKMEHADLVAEMQTVENLPTHERLQLARLRRAQQLKAARQKEKEWLKLQRTKGNTITQQNQQQPQPLSSRSTNTTHHFRSDDDRVRHISFEKSVVLLEAASRNDMQEVAELLQRGITPDAANEDGLTALHQCCIDNNVDMLRLLLEYGANVDAQDSDKWTPLHAAATCGHLELVRILIFHGANLLAVNTDGNMPYDLCDDEQTLDYIEAEMSKRGVTQELIDETRSSTEQQMLQDLTAVAQNGGDLEEPDSQSATPLHIAAANGYVRVVEFLLELHVNVDALDKDMWSPVHAAACWGHLEVLEMLAQCGADLNAKNKDDETPSDICEDPEIRERIDQLKTEQESKRLAEAQRRRVRRSQSNNTRAQSVRRTSLRDKTLTTKKDAVEEARLRLQAQEVFTHPTADSNNFAGDDNVATSCSSGAAPTDASSVTSATYSGHGWLKSNAATASASSNLHNNNGNCNNNNMLNNNNNNSVEKNSFQSADLNDDSAILNPHAISAADVDTTMAVVAASRRPPDGREHNTDELQLSCSKTSGISGVGTTSNAEAFQVQSKEAANGKINVQVTVLVDTLSTRHHYISSPQQLNQQHLQSLTTQQQIVLSPQLDLATVGTLSNSGGATLANLKKQRSLSRTHAHNSCSSNNNTNYLDGSVLGTSNNTTTASNNNNNNNNNNHTASDTDLGAFYQQQQKKPHDLVSQQPTAATGALLDYNNTNGLMLTTATTTNPAVIGGDVNKFSGITGDVVSDSASSKRCCTLM